jgi:hypothetical protein
MEKAMKYYITSAGNPTILDERIENLLDMKDWKEISEKEFLKADKEYSNNAGSNLIGEEK